MNIEGNPVDECVNYGTVCGRAAAAFFCRYLGKKQAALLTKQASSNSLGIVQHALLKRPAFNVNLLCPSLHATLWHSCMHAIYPPALAKELLGCLTGFDGLADDELVVVPAAGPVRALSGEWCVSPGQYITSSNITQAAQLEKVDGLACSRIDAVTCYRRCRQLLNALLSTFKNPGWP